MKKFLSMLAGAVMLFAGSASAASYSDTILFGLDGIVIDPFNTSASGQFNILDEGYNPSNEEIVSFRVEATFLDLIGNETFSATLGPRTFTGLGPLPNLELTTLSTDSSDPGNADVLEALSLDGLLDLEFTFGTGSFIVVSATLTAESVSVPDGGSTVALLGLGMIGLAGAAKRFSRR